MRKRIGCMKKGRPHPPLQLKLELTVSHANEV